VEDIVSDDTIGYFEWALLVDVLEHVVDRDALMRTVIKLLRPDGRVVLSVPNIAHWTARYEILCGRFRYRSHGLFDDTHVRFYTRESVEAFLESHGQRIVSWDQSIGLFQYWQVPRVLNRVAAASWYQRKLVRVAAKYWPELFAYQFVVTAERSS